MDADKTSFTYIANYRPSEYYYLSNQVPYKNFEAMAQYSGLDGISKDNKRHWKNSYWAIQPTDHEYYYSYYESGYWGAKVLGGGYKSRR